MKNLGEIRYFSKLNMETKKIIKIGLAHNNENITKMRILNINYNNDHGFPILKLEKNYIPFWFECPNVEIYNMKDKNECEVKIASFANYVSIKKRSKEDNDVFADESYIADWKQDPTVAFISGVIRGYKLEKMLSQIKVIILLMLTAWG